MATDHRGREVHAGKRTSDELFQLGYSGKNVDPRLPSWEQKRAPEDYYNPNAFTQEVEGGVVDDHYAQGVMFGTLDNMVKNSNLLKRV